MRPLVQIQRGENCDVVAALPTRAQERLGSFAQWWRIELTGPGNTRLTVEAPTKEEALDQFAKATKSTATCYD